MDRAEYQRGYQQKNKDRIKEVRRIWRVNHSETTKAQSFRYSQKLKREVLTHYGRGNLSCVKCGENRIACLSIDHIKGDGAEHRARTGTTRIYAWLRVRGYPEGYQTLCMNCQFVKRDRMKEYKAGPGVVRQS